MIYSKLLIKMRWKPVEDPAHGIIFVKGNRKFIPCCNEYSDGGEWIKLTDGEFMQREIKNIELELAQKISEDCLKYRM